MAGGLHRIRAQDLSTADLVAAADEAWAVGDHAAVAELLRPVLDDPGSWSELRSAAPDVAEEVAYRGGMSLLQHGDPDGAARASGSPERSRRSTHPASAGARPPPVPKVAGTEGTGS